MRAARSLGLAAAAALGVLCARAGCEEPAPTPSTRADEVLAALKDADAGRLSALASSPLPDRWLVADELCARGQCDSAARFAAAAPVRPDVAALPAFVESRRKAPISPAVRKALAGTGSAQIQLIEAARSAAPAFDRARLSFELATRLDADGRRTDAAAAWLDAATNAETAGWLSVAAEACHYAGDELRQEADYGGARAAWERRLALDRRRDDAEAVISAGTNLAGLAALVGDYRTALAQYRQALTALGALVPRGDDRILQVLSNVAMVAALRGDYAGQLAACEDGTSRLAASAPAELRAHFLWSAGDAHLELGDVDRALERHRAALRAAEEGQDPLLKVKCRGSIARDLVVKGALDEAVDGFEAALRSLQSAEAAEAGEAVEMMTMKTHANLADVQGRRGDAAAARSAGAKALALAERFKDDATTASVQQFLALACRGAKDLDAANAWAAKSLEIAGRLDSSRLICDGWRETAENALAAGDAARAVDACRKAVVQIVRMTSGLAEGQGAQARERFGRVFQLAKSAAIAQGDAATLLEFAESGRAVDFLTSLEQGDAIRSAAVPSALREAEEAARVAESTAALRRDAARASNDFAAAKARSAEFDAARAQHEDAIGRIRREVRGAAIFPQSVSERQARAALGADDALVVYVLGDEKAAALVLTAKGMRLVPLGATKDIAAACATWDPAADAASADAAIAALKKALVDPLVLTAATRRVLVSPDGDVFRAPLAALFTGREVVHVPSASSYVLLAADKALHGEKVLAVGAPDYAGRTGLAALPESGAEAKAAGGAVGDVVLTGAAATEAGVRAALGREKRWRAIHFAVHGLVDTKRPMLSGLELTAAAPDDGLLTALEVVQQPVPADLVVLSACGSGGGRVFTGEGLVGLPRAFLFAGSPRVIASSWKADDAATCFLMTKFYELWRGKGLRASAALAGAQDAVRSDERWRHPRYWAAWCLWGTGD